MRNKLKILLPIALGVFFIYLTYRLTSQEERTLIWKYMMSAKIEFILSAMFLGASSDLIRGLRWRLLSKSIGYDSNLITSVGSVFMCYTSNMAFPRSGELLRASVLSSYNNIPIGKTLGTIAVERIIDVIISLIILTGIWALQYEVIIESFFDVNMLYYINDNIITITLIIFLVISLTVYFINRIELLRNFFQGVFEGLFSVTKLKSKLILFILFSIMIWACYMSAFFLIKFSVSELTVIDNNLIIPAFLVGVYSISLSNHGLGVYPLAISLFLANFGINTEIGLTYGWLAWSCQAIITLIFGALSFFVLPLLKASD